MDWLTFKFCVFIWALCVSNLQTQLLNSSTSIISTEVRTACIDDQPVPAPDECNTCICYAGLIYCTHLSCSEQQCDADGELDPPDPCNKCVCRKGKVTCSDRICITASNCAENELYPAQDDCNACVCTNGFISCTTNRCDKEIMQHTTPLTTPRPKKKRKCVDGTHIPAPNDCTECICRNGKKRCKNICNKPKVESRFKEAECVSGQHVPKPDRCNNCICFEGQIHCTHMACPRDTRIDRECTEDQPVIRPDECNECYCFEGKLECSDLICIRGSKCVEGEEIPKPDGCNVCKCVEGHILCTDYQCPIPVSRNALSPDVQPLVECQEGDVIPPPLPPNDCNTCICMENTILCSANTCVVSVPEITGRLAEQKEQTDLEVFDKKISMEPFVSMLAKNYDKSPTKLIHTHAYNGYHQEIKVHSSNLPKDATQLLRVLATTLDNPALASISQRLSPSENDDQENPTNVTSRETDTLVAQSSKLITSGSRSNETIIVVPNPELFDNQNSQLPLITKHETTWKSESGSAPVVSTNNVIYQPEPKGKPAQFGHPGLSHLLPPKPTPVNGEIPKINTPPIYQTLKPTLINNNDGKMSYTPFPKESSPFKQLHPYRPTQPGPNIYNFSSPHPLHKPGNFIVTPNNNGGQQTLPQAQFVPNPPKFYPNQVQPQQFQPKPNQNLLPNVNNNGILRPPVFPNKPNQPIVSANQFKPSPPPLGLKPGQGSIGPLNNKGNQSDQQFKFKHPQNFQINPPRHNPPAQLKSISYRGFDNSEEIPSYAHFESNSPNILITPQNEENSDPTQHKLLDSQFGPNSSTYDTHEYESPKVNDLNSTEKQLQPYSITTYIEHHGTPPSLLNRTNKVPTHSHYTKHTTITYISEYDSAEQSNPSLAGQALNQQYNAPYNNEYESYLPEMPNTEYGSLESDDITPKVNHYLNLPNLQLDQSEPDLKLTKYYLPHNSLFPGQRQNDTLKVHPTLFEVYKYDQTDPWNKSNHLFDKFINPSSEGSTGPINFYQNRTNPITSVYPNIFTDHLQSPYKSLFKFPQDQDKKGGFNDYGSAEGLQFPSNLAEDPAHPTEIKHLPLQSISEPTQNQYKPRVSHDGGSMNGFKHPHNIYEDPRQLKPFNIETPQSHHLQGAFDEPVPTNSLQYPSNSAGDLSDPQLDQNKQNFDPAHPKENLHGPLSSPLAPSQDQLKPRVLDNNEVNDRYKYGHNAVEIPINFKPVHQLLQSSLGPNLIQNTTGMFNEPGSADTFQNTPNSTGNPVFTRGNQHNLPLTKLGPLESQHLPGLLNYLHKRYPFSSLPTQNQHTPAQLDDTESADGFHYPSESAGDSAHPRGKPLNSPFGSTQNKPASHSPGVFDDRASGDHFSYPSNSAEDSKHPRDKPPKSVFAPTQNQHLPGIFDNSASPDGFHNPSDSVGDGTYPRGKPLNSPFGSTQNKPASHLPGVFDDRASGDHFSYPSNSAEDSIHPRDKPSKSLYAPTQKQHLPGIFDNSASPDGFHNPSDSAGDATHPRGKPLNSPFGSTQNKPASHLPGVFDDRASGDHFSYPSNSAEDSIHPRDKPSKSLYAPTQKQHLPGIFDNSASPDGFHNPSDSAGDATHPRGKPPNSPFGSTQNKPASHLPGVFDDRASGDHFSYPSNSAEDSIHPRDKPSKSLYAPTQNQHLQGIFDNNASPDGFHNPSDSAGDATHPRGKPPNSPFGSFQNQPASHLPGVFDDRASGDHFSYPSDSAEDSIHPRDKPPKSLFAPTQNQHLPGIFDNSASPDGFHNPSDSAGDSSHPRYKPPNSPFGSTQNKPASHSPGVFDDHASGDYFSFPSNSAEDPQHSRGKPLNSPFDSSQNQPASHLPGVFDDRASGDHFSYPSNSAEDPKYSGNKPPKSLFPSTQNQPGMFDNSASPDGFYNPSDSAGDSTHPRGKPPNSPFGSTQNKPASHLPGVFDDRASGDHFSYPSNSAEDPKHSGNKPLNSLFPSTQNQPGMFDNSAFPDGFHNPSDSAGDSTHPRGKPLNSPFGSTQNKPASHLPGVFDDRASGDHFSYPSNSAEDPKHIGNKPPKSLFAPIQNQHSPGIFDNSASPDGFHNPSDSAGDSTHPRGKPPNSSFGSTQNKPAGHSPGIFDDRASGDHFSYPYNSAEDPKHSGNKPLNSLFPSTQNQPGMFDNSAFPDGFHNPSDSAGDSAHSRGNPLNSPFGSTQNKPASHLPGVFDDRASGDHFSYPSNSAEDPKHIGNKPPKSLFAPTQNQHSPGIFDNSASPDGFHNPSDSAGDSTHPRGKPPNSSFGSTQNKPASHLPGVFDDRASGDYFSFPSNSAEDPHHSRGKPLNSPFGSTQNKPAGHLPGVFDDRASGDHFSYPSNSAENPKHSGNKPAKSLFPPTQNQLGMFDNSASPDGFHNPSDSAGDATHPRGKPPNSPFGSTQNQPASHLPGVFDDRASGDYFSFPSNSAEDSIYPRDKSPKSLFAPTQNQHLPGIFDNSASADGFHNPSDSAGDSTHPRGKPPNSPFGATQNKPVGHSPGIFDDRASGDYFSFPSNSAEDPQHSRGKPLNSPFGSSQNQPASLSPGVFDDRASGDYFSYPSNSAEEPQHSRDKPPKSLFSPTQNLHVPETLEDSADGFQNPSNSTKNPTHLKGKPIYSQLTPTLNQHIPGILNPPVSADNSQYPSNSAEFPTHPKLNQNTPALSQFYPAQNQRLPGVLDKPASSNSSNYLPNSAEILTHPKRSQHNPEVFQLGPTQSQHLPSVIIVNRSISVEDPTDSKGEPPIFPIGPTQTQNLSQVYADHESNNGSHYPRNSAESLTHPNLSQHNPGVLQFGPAQNPHLPWVLDDRSNSVEDPKNSKDKQPNSPLGTTQNQDLSGVYDPRESVKGYLSDSAKNPTSTVNDPYTIPDSKFKQIQNQPKPSSLDIDIVSKQNKNQPENKSVLKPKNLADTKYNNMIPLKPSLFDTLFNEVYNVPWLLPKDLNNVTSAFKPDIQFDHEQYKPSLFDHFFKGILDIPWSDPNLVNKAFVYYTEITTHPSGAQAKQDIYKPSTNQDPLLSIPNQNGNTDISDADPNELQTEQYMSTPSTTLIKSYSTQYNPLLNVKHIGDSNNLIPNDGGKTLASDDQLFPLYTAAKKLSKPFLIDKSDFGVNNTDQLDFLPFSVPDIAKIVTHEPSSEQMDGLTPENDKFDVPKIVNELVNWLPDQLQKYVPTKHNPNVTAAKKLSKPLLIDKSESGEDSTDPLDVLPALVPDIAKIVTHEPSSEQMDGSTPENDKFDVPKIVNELINWLPGQLQKYVPTKHNPNVTAAKKLSKPLLIDKSESGVNSTDQPDVLPSSVPDIAKIVTHEPSSEQMDGSTPENYKFEVPEIVNSIVNWLPSKLQKYVPTKYNPNVTTAAKKLSKPFLIDKSESGVNSTDQLDVLPSSVPDIAKIVTHEPSSEQIDESTLENDEFEAPKTVNGVVNWLPGKLQKYVPTKYNSNVTQNGTNINKIFNLLSKLTPSELKHSAAKLKKPFKSSKPKLIEDIGSILEEDAIPTTQSPSIEVTTYNLEDRLKTDPTVLKDKGPQADEYKYPEVHIILHQGDDEDDEDLATYLQPHSEKTFNDTGPEGSGASSLPFKSRLNRLPKDHKEECGDGTHWITNCHGCSCYFGQAMCFKIPDCELRRFGEPMTCKPYSHFKLGECYTCVCNGDGVAECDATDCKTEPSIQGAGTTDSSVPAFTEFFDDKKANDILQYYTSNKKLPKDCPNPNSQTQFPTCERGTSWVSSCHKCECDESGQHKCNKIDGCILDYDSYGKPSKCKPNSKFYPKTNSMPCVECTCDDEGTTHCPGYDNKTQ